MPTPTIAVFIRGGLVQDVCADMPCRVIVLDFDTDQGTMSGDGKDESNAGWLIRHTHPDGWEEDCYLSDYDLTDRENRGQPDTVLCAIATAADAEHGSDEEADEITRDFLLNNAASRGDFDEYKRLGGGD